MKLRTATYTFFTLVGLALLANIAFLAAMGRSFDHDKSLDQDNATAMVLVDDLERHAAQRIRLLRGHAATGQARYQEQHDHLIAAQVDSLGQRARAIDSRASGQTTLGQAMAGLWRLNAVAERVFAAPDRAQAVALAFGPALEASEQAFLGELAAARQRIRAHTEHEVEFAISGLRRALKAAEMVDVGLLVAMLAAAFVVWARVIRPTDALARTASRLAEGDHSARTRPDEAQVQELASLARTLDRMATSVQDELTQRQRRERELEVAHAAVQAATEAKSRFLATMSHEIRTPMNAVIGLSELVLHSELDARQRAHIEQVARSARHLLELLNNVLDLAKMEAGRMSLEQVPCSLDDIIDTALMMLRLPATERGLELDRVDSPGCAPPRGQWIQGDPLRLTQVLLNLLSNAVKFTERGRVSLSVAVENGHTLELALRDSGVGMDAAALEGLFQDYMQADATTPRRFGGTGLGLSISRRLVELMGGTLTASSAPAQGSCFVVRLPYRPVAALAPPGLEAPAAGHVPSLAGLRVLVAEDNLVNALIAREMLSLEGAQVEVVEDGQQALDWLHRHGARACDVVLMDLQMPVLDGLQASRAITADPALRGLPVIAMTAHTFEEERQRCREAGMVEHISKPVHRATIVRLLSRYLKPVAAAA